MNELDNITGAKNGLRELALFAGAGGGILGGKLLGWRTVCAVEIDEYARNVLVARQDDGCLEPFPIWDDIRTFDGHPWRGHVDVISGGFPCQDISAAGRGAGITGERSGLWKQMARIVGEVRPRYVFVENSPMLVRRGLGTVLGDLSEMGYDARWGVLGAHHAGAPHKRDRIWILADSKVSRQGGIGSWQEEGISGAWSGREVPSFMADAEHKWIGRRKQQSEGSEGSRHVANTNGLHEQGKLSSCTDSKQREEPGERPSGSCRDGCGWWETEPDVGRVAHGVASRVDRLRCIGNGQVPSVVRLAWNTLLNL